MKKYLVYFLIIVGSLMIPVNAASAQDFISSPTVVDGVLVTYQPPEGEVAQKCSAGWTKVEADGKPDSSNPDREVSYELPIPSDGQYELIIAAYGISNNGNIHNAGMYALWSIAGQESVTTIPDNMMAVITWQGPLTTDQQVSGIYRYGTYPDEPYTAWGITYQLCLVRVADLPTLTPTVTQTLVPTATPSPINTATASPTTVITHTVTPAPTMTKQPTATSIATASPTSVVTATMTVTPTTTAVIGTPVTLVPTETATACLGDGCETNIGQTPEPTAGVTVVSTVDAKRLYLPLIQRTGTDGDLFGVDWPWPGVLVLLFVISVIVLLWRIRRLAR